MSWRSRNQSKRVYKRRWKDTSHRFKPSKRISICRESKILVSSWSLTRKPISYREPKMSSRLASNSLKNKKDSFWPWNKIWMINSIRILLFRPKRTQLIKSLNKFRMISNRRKIRWSSLFLHIKNPKFNSKNKPINSNLKFKTKIKK